MSRRCSLPSTKWSRGFPPPVEVDDLSILGPLVDEPGARRRGDRGEALAVGAQLDVEVAGVGLLLFASRAGVLHDEARHRTSRTEIHLQEQGIVVSAPAIGLASRHAAVHRLLRPLIRAARLTSSGGPIEREVHLAIRPVDLELVNPGHRLAAVGRTADIQADEAGVDGRLDHVGGRPRIRGALPDAPCPRRPASPRPAFPAAS